MKDETKSARKDDLDDGDAFLPDPRKGGPQVRDTLAEMVAEEYIASATTGEERFEEDREQVTPDELGGPFVEVSADQEFADHDPEGEELESDDKEPFPTAMRSTSR